MAPDNDHAGDDGQAPTSSSIPRLPAASASASLLRGFLYRNVPFLLTDATQQWQATQAWVAPGEAAAFFSIDLLEAAFRGGQVQVPVVACGAGSGSYGEEPRRECALREYAALWRSGEAEAQGLYLKDWHIVRALRSLQTGHAEEPGKGIPYPSSSYYAVPAPLDDDWLNAWWDAPATDAGHADRDDDYRFLYLGPRGSTTGLHHDVLCSYSWSANLAGFKAWTLFSPEATPSLYTDAAQTTIRPMADILRDEQVPHLTLTQGPGEVLFVPSGWHHTVTNLTGCLSINHNWLNRSCLPRVWAFLQKEAAAVQARLLDLKETFDARRSGWERQCEVVLRANSALNLTEWLALLLVKARRVLQLQQLAAATAGQEEDEEEEEERCKDLVVIHTVLCELARPPHAQFLFPAHLYCEADASPPLTETFRPRVQAWMAAEKKRIEKGMDGVHRV